MMFAMSLSFGVRFGPMSKVYFLVGGSVMWDDVFELSAFSPSLCWPRVLFAVTFAYALLCSLC